MNKCTLLRSSSLVRSSSFIIRSSSFVVPRSSLLVSSVFTGQHLSEIPMAHVFTLKAFVSIESS